MTEEEKKKVTGEIIEAGIEGYARGFNDAMDSIQECIINCIDGLKKTISREKLYAQFREYIESKGIVI